MTDSQSCQNPEIKGWLKKWTNCIKRYKRRWFVLSNGQLSYYKNQFDALHLCRGTISIDNALIHPTDSCSFVISNEKSHKFYIKTSNKFEMQRWITALELAKTEATRNNLDLKAKEDSQSKTPVMIQNASRSLLSKHLKRRTRIPDRPDYPLNLWSIVKNCVGKELTKVPMPVNFSEPLSMLQRLTEDYEYSNVLDYAAECIDTLEQLAYVAAFTVSSYSSTVNRNGKPFNPLLGETYECDRRDDLGWRVISEQVSHHPPIVAQYCEGKKWICWQEFTMTSKFRGKYLTVVPIGIAHCQFTQSGNHYTWEKVTTTVHNIIIGKLWIDHHGNLEIINHINSSKCELRYIPYSYFSNEIQRKVTGCVFDETGIARWLISGTWDRQIDIAPIIINKGSLKKPVYIPDNYVTAWKRIDPPLDCEKYYNFTLLACQLNEMEEGVAPTDSRLRPDQRLMEEGKWGEANVVKRQLEEKQRLKRRQRSVNTEMVNSTEDTYLPVWFEKELDPVTGQAEYKYKGRYWECKEKQDWTLCPDIFQIQ